MEYSKRKPIRLNGFDYGQGGAYFITICTKNRQNLFWENVDVGAAISRPPLSCFGQIAEKAILSIPNHYPNAAAERYVIMPNHIHMILRITAGDGRQVAAPTVSQIVGGMKWYISREIRRPVWQKSFYDHVIRSETDCLEIARYIENNPARWAEDELYIP